MPKTIGIAAHSAEGGGLCFLTACREGAKRLGAHMHPDVVLSAVPMGLSMNGWNTDDYGQIRPHLARGVQQVADAGADFFVCPDNTAHLVLEEDIDNLALPGLHIADAVCSKIKENGWSSVGLLGTRWTMTGRVYADKLRSNGMSRVTPPDSTQAQINDAIFDELCQNIIRPATTDLFVRAIESLRQQGAECVILGCTEIPLIIDDSNSPLPTLDSTRLLARYAVYEAISTRTLPERGWLPIE